MDCLGHVLFFFFFEQINGKKKNSLVIKMVSDDKLLIMDMDMNINERRYMNINLSLDFSLSNLSYLCLKKIKNDPVLASRSHWKSCKCTFLPFLVLHYIKCYS